MIKLKCAGHKRSKWNGLVKEAVGMEFIENSINPQKSKSM